jgi:HK97 family phage major capsid protein
MSSLNHVELGQQLEAKRTEYRTKFDGYPVKKMANGQEAKDIPANDIEGLRTLMAEIDDLGKKFEDAKKLSTFFEEMPDGTIERKTGQAPTNRPEVEAKSGDPEQKEFFSRMFAEAKAKGGLKRGLQMDFKWDPRLEFKTTMTTSAGYTPFSDRSNVRVDTVQILPTLFDYLPIIPIGQQSYKFMKETTFTNNAGVKGEGVAYDEAALALTETTVSMNRTGVYIPVTEDQLEDEPAAMAYIEDRLKRMVRIKAEYQALNGNGTEPQWEGILNLAGVQTVDASGFGSDFDAVFRAILNIGRWDATTYGGAQANLVVLNPTDWEELVTQRTTDGVYILGNPGNAPLSRVWGLPVAQNFTLAAGTGLVLDTSYFPIGMRRDMRVAITDSHGENFIAGVLTVRVDMKGNVIAYRDAAAVKITNL